MDQAYSDYLHSILPDRQTWVLELERKAKEDRIPIMDAVSMHFLLQILRMKEPTTILEIGTAIGYSALRMSDVCPASKIITIEKDEKRYYQALENVQRLEKTEQIKIRLGDALEVLEALKEEKHCFDVVFIDAAKGKYKQFFELSIPILAPKGIIISDNVLFRGFMTGKEEVPPRYKNLVKKLRQYNEYLMSHPSFNTVILPVGDGVGISQHVERAR